MNMQFHIQFRLLIVSMVIGFALVACADMKDFTPTTPEGTATAKDSIDTVIRFSIRLAQPADSRAEDTDDLNGTPAENVVKTLVLGITDEHWNLMAYTPQLTDISSSTDPNYDYQFTHQFRLPRGKMHITVIANLGAAQFSQLFQQAQGLGDQGDIIHYLPVVNESNTYADVIGYFAPNSGGKSRNADISKGIVMTGFGMYKGSEEIELDRSYTDRNPLPVTVKLTRTIAKVHLLTNDEDGYLPTYPTDANMLSNRDGSAMGFIKTSDIIYTINSLNKRSYLMPRKATNTDYLYEDPNMTMTGSNGFINLATNPATYINIPENFVYKTSRDFSVLSPANKESRFEHAEKYDEARFNAQPWSNNRYTRGMYATENLYDKPALGTALSSGQDGTTLGNPILANNQKEAVRAITTISVGVRLMPREILFDTDKLNGLKSIANESTNTQLPDSVKTRFLQIMNRYQNEVIADDNVRYPEWLRPHKNDATAKNPTVINFGNPQSDSETLTDNQIYADIEYLLTLSLRYNDKFAEWRNADLPTGTNKYPTGTYWVYEDEGSHYFLSAAMAASSLITDNSTRLLATSPRFGGWCFYFSYIRDTNAAADYTSPTEPIQAYVDGQVTRNKYYLLRLQRILTPGAGFFSGDYIQLSTKRFDWVNGGQADVILN